MKTTRRQFLARAAGGIVGTVALLDILPAIQAAAQSSGGKIRLSACDWSLGASGPGAVEVAKKIGLDGIEVSTGGPADTLDIGKADFRAQYKELCTKTGIVVSSVAMGLLNGSPLASEPRGPAWLEQAIEATQDLGAKVILLAFFGKGDLQKDGKLKKEDIDVVVDRLKEAAPKAQKAGVILGLENTLSAKDNLAILDRVKSDVVKVYYDIGNSTGGGYDVPAEIRELKDRICQIHFKDGSNYLGEGKVKMEPVAEAIGAINYQGWIVLETAIPSKDRDADFTRNATFVRKLLKLA